jgi:hypothetical protein
VTLALPPFAAVPESFVGVWRRTLLEGPGIDRDTDSTVFWLQTSHWHGDLRLPPRRPAFADITEFAATTEVQRRWLAQQQGFAGYTEVTGWPMAGSADTPACPTVCQWHRRLDFQPPRGARDIGRVAFAAGEDRLDEWGIDADYHEIWQRVPESTGEQAAWGWFGVEPVETVQRLLLVAGHCFFSLRDRGQSAAPGVAIGAPTATLQQSTDVLAWLDMELSYGNWDPSLRLGTILHSTLPWREGQVLAWTPDWRRLTP